jgi:hypothetical protein
VARAVLPQILEDYIIRYQHEKDPDITSTTEDSIHALTSRITNMKLTNLKGEAITKAVSQLHGAIAALKIVGQVPHEIKERLLDIFQASYVVKFNATFRVMRIQHRTLAVNFL